MMKKTAVLCSAAILAVLGCKSRAFNSSEKSTTNTGTPEADSIVLVAASGDDGSVVAVFEKNGKLIEKGDYFCGARSDGMGGVYGSIRGDDQLRCFRSKDALLAVSEHGQRLDCARGENTHDGLVTRCVVWENFNRGGFVDVRLRTVRDDTCTGVFKAKPYTEPMYCSVLYSSPGGSVIASYSCYPTLEAFKKYGREQTELRKNVEIQCKYDQTYNPTKMYTEAPCSFKLMP